MSIASVLIIYIKLAGSSMLIIDVGFVVQLIILCFRFNTPLHKWHLLICMFLMLSSEGHAPCIGYFSLGRVT